MSNLLTAIATLFITEKDYLGRNIDEVISRLAAQTESNAHEWAYLRDEKVYENTVSGLKVYPHERCGRAA
ncbi:hypothetical protein HGP28_10380 [Vibrio sp. SM6]|uniref:Uncharacterized protein n=1 Tax=Vibrio agarilyticus TaxID=2726741 RepID=A0A7X8YHF3_9VIBR|nr:hypothetical protein [Vibrio agarilyticus]NLS13297.1 hypothetical protein [Vibrio agarilyticus]